jgi:hypothetical protein
MEIEWAMVEKVFFFWWGEWLFSYCKLQVECLADCMVDWELSLLIEILFKIEGPKALTAFIGGCARAQQLAVPNIFGSSAESVRPKGLLSPKKI